MTPSRKYKHLSIRIPDEVTSGPDAVLDHAVGWIRRLPHIRRRLRLRGRRAHAACLRYASLPEEELREKLEARRILVRRRGALAPRDSIQCLGLIGAAARHALGLTPYPVQFMAALALLEGRLAEMATGEGKTLTTGLAATALGWTGKPLHVLTSNEYLAERDATELTPLFTFCHASVGFVVPSMEPAERAKAYAKDIVYTTSKDLLADFLRDRLLAPGVNTNERLLALDSFKGTARTGQRERILRGVHSALVDEADSVLIDDAVTPLIISQKYKNESFNECCKIANEIAGALRESEHYRVHYRRRRIQLTQEGIRAVRARAESLPAMWRSFERSQELIELAINARVFFQRDRDYIVEDGKVVIVDQNTGRQKVDSTWRGGVHQAIEIKEGIAITDATRTLASMTFQRFFRLYRHLGATTGTVLNAAPEFWQMYRLSNVKIPTHRPCIRRNLGTRYFSTLDEKQSAVTATVRRIHETGQPILIGTDSVEASLELASRLERAGLKFNLLNASAHADEARIIRQAGSVGAITIATNMAGRGTDVKLGLGAAALGGLFVIACSRMESRRVDRQLYGRAGRQGDPGSAETYVSLEDRLLKQKHGPAILSAAGNLLAGRLPGAATLAARITRKAQRRAETHSRRQRKNMMHADKWLKESLTFSGDL